MSIKTNTKLARIAQGAAALLTASFLFAMDASAGDLKILRLGLGVGSIASDASHPGITCGDDCDETYGSVSVTLTATPSADSTFAGWSGDCSGTGTCVVNMSASHLVRAQFNFPTPTTIADFSPEGIAAYLNNPANVGVNSPARFIAALPQPHRRNWILMTRSESLQTGTAKSPRILLPSTDARYVFTIGATTHSSYPGAHPNAIEYMQWDATQKNFRFHEIIVGPVPDLGDIITHSNGTTGPRFPARSRSISIDDAKCPKCHSTRNVLNLNRTVTPATPGTYPGTDGVTPGTVVVKNKPNWDAYDSWGGALPFNRDRIYQGSLEATAFRHLMNLWNWRNNDTVRQVIEQLELQPPYSLGASPHRITRDVSSLTDDPHIQFGFDGQAPLATTSNTVGYNFDGTTSTASSVDQGGRYVTMRVSSPNPDPETFNDTFASPGSDEGRGVQLFDLLGGLDGSLNAQRIADELINHRFATGSVPIDVRPIAMAISKGTCLRIDTATNTVKSATHMPAYPDLTVDMGFFDSRNGMNIVAVRDNTKTNWSTTTAATRSTDFPRRKVDIQKRNFDRTGDPYLAAPENGLIQEYGGATAGDTSVERLRREIFRRPIDVGNSDVTMMGGKYVDRESYGYNTDRVSLYRYFLEPLGVSVDKWSMSVRGRSRAYNFADVFSTYANVFEPELQASMLSRTIPGLTDPNDCAQLINAINTTLSSSALPPATGAGAVPKYTDIQRIFNKSCIECHGGLGYPPYGTGSLDFSEDEDPPAVTTPMVSPRLARAYDNAVAYVGADLPSSFLHTLITRTAETCPPGGTGMMPCGGPPLSKTDVKTIERWILGPPAVSKADGDPHITTVDGTPYDFQSAGEFVLLRDEGLEVQSRQTPVSTNGPLSPNDHTGLASCVSVNTAAAIRVGAHRITYQPDINGKANPEGLQLRVDGKLTNLGVQGIILPSGGRIMRTSAQGGIQIDAPGGTAVVLTPGWWSPYQLWFMNIDIQHPRATEGVMGAIAPNNWLPALPDGTLLGPRPRDLHQRYVDLYEKFEAAWRVGDTTSLFDYAPGMTTHNFSAESWPVENPQSCIAPPLPSGPATQEPAKPVALEVAQQHCNAVVDANRKKNCVQDVMATGEPAFAKTYLASEKIERNTRPTAPVLGLPLATDIDLVKPVRFTWGTATDADGDVVTYRHCVWSINERPSFNKCDITPITVSPLSNTSFCLLLIALIALLLLVLWLFLKAKHRRNLLMIVVAAFLLVLVALGYVGGSAVRTGAKTLAQFETGKTYYWKVIAEDGQGGVTESETRRFTTK